ncbi:MAG: cytochrome c biogenesis protein CcdA [Candidatus Woesearchaeota archaeon]
MRYISLSILFAAMLCVTAFGVQAQQQKTDILFFYGQGCPHCANEEAFLEDMQGEYPALQVHLYEVYFNDEHRQLMIDLAEAYGQEVSGVPMTFINGKIIKGFSDAISRSIEQEIIYCVENGCADPHEMIGKDAGTDIVSIEGDMSPADDPEKNSALGRLTLGAVVTAAAVDAINPCAFAVLIILLTTILSAGKKKRALGAGFAFSASIYISYLLMGIGLFTAIQAAGMTRIFYSIFAVLAIILGLFNLKDWLWYGKWFVMEVPMSWRPHLKTLIKGVTSIPGAFLIGFAVSLFLLPCTSGPYIVILGLLAKTATKNHALSLLLLYNLVFILPMILITLAVYFGFTTTEKAEKWRTGRLQTLHLIAGMIMILLGISMFVAMGLGYI